MEVSLLATLMEVTTPLGVTFNQWGVAQKGLRYDFSYRRLNVTFNVIALNGLWGGALQVRAHLWGCGGPLCREDCKFSSFEECVAYLWGKAFQYVCCNQRDVPSEFIQFRKEMGKWFSGSDEEKRRNFMEANFYAF